MRVFEVYDTDFNFYTIPAVYLRVGDRVTVYVKDTNNKIIIKEVTVNIILAIKDIPDSEIDL